MICSVHSFTLILASFSGISLCQEWVAVPINGTSETVPYADGGYNETLDFPAILKENKKYKTFLEQCSLRIVGGKKASIYAVPYQVALRKPYLLVFRYTFCGGSLITLKYVLTAAHCFSHPCKPLRLRTVRVVAGTTKSTVTIGTARKEHSRKIRVFFKHKNYNSTSMFNDIGILELKAAFIESSSIKPIRMVSKNEGVILKNKSLVLVLGFGKTERGKAPSSLLMVCLPLVSNDVCGSYYGSEYLSSRNFCAFERGKDSCQGDSGGPVVKNGILVGITSWGGVCGVHPGVYTHLEYYTSNDDTPFVGKRANTDQASYVAPCVATVLCWIGVS